MQGSYTSDVWVMKLKLDGTTASSNWQTVINGNTIDGRFYGSRKANSNQDSTGEDLGLDIKQDHDGNYVVVGQAWRSSDDVPSGTQSPPDGDIWVFKLDPSSGNIISGKNKVYVQSGAHRGNDYATSLVVDCNSPNDYVVSTFCKSCDPNPTWNTGFGPWQQMWLLKIHSDFSSYTDEQYGWDSNPNDKWDYGAFNIIQLHEGVFGTCSSGDGFLSFGVQHPTTLAGCFASNHDFLAVKTNNALVNNANFNSPCTNAKRLSTNTSAGVAHGGRYGDTGQSAVETCAGYLLVGFTTSNDMDTPTQTNFCAGNAAGCDVSCNNYDCDADPQPSDIWMVMVDATNGSYLWDESIGSGYGFTNIIPDDKAFSIKQTPDGSYIIAGKRVDAVHGDDEFYVAKFELAAACDAPGNLTVTTTGYCASLSWDMSPCVPRYKLEYKKLTAGTWTPVDYATSPVIVNNNSGSGGNAFEWRVTAYCSPNNASVANGSNYSIPHCTQILTGCTNCHPRLGIDSVDYSNLLIIFPNPSDGSFKVLFQTPYQSIGSCLIEILDQAGKSISSSTYPIENGLVEQQMTFGNLASGFYWIKVTVDGKHYQTKLVLQKD